jgi:translation initiation factor IF-3
MKQNVSVLTLPQRRAAVDIDRCIPRSGESLSCGESFFVRFFLLSQNGGVFRISTKELLINEEIKAKEVRVVGPEGDPIGIMAPEAALKIAYDQGYDLVLMAPQAQPPVCRIMDYGKYRFERDKKEKEAKKKQQVVELKEIQLSCRIDTHDFETKARHAVKFLESGNKVRVVMRFKGREMSHVSIGQEIMKKFEDACSTVGSVDKAPVLDGRIMSMVVSPLKLK